MKTKTLVCLGLVTLFLTACLGDKKSINVDEANDSTSFINKDFKGNPVDYKDDMSACYKMTKADLAKLYDVNVEDIVWMDSSVNERMTTVIPTCNFRVMMGENDYNYLIGGISVHREINKNEMMGEIAEATGGGENWEEAWALQKSISKSAEWVKGLGLAAMWKPNKRELHIKFDGYSVYIMAPGAAFNKEEAAKKRDYKKIALAIAQQSGYID